MPISKNRMEDLILATIEYLIRSFGVNSTIEKLLYEVDYWTREELIASGCFFAEEVDEVIREYEESRRVL